MNDWPYKARDLAITHSIITQMASFKGGTLRFLEAYHVDEKTDTFTFTLSPWVNILINAFRALYPANELIKVIGKVLDETLKPLDGLRQEEAVLFRNLVTYALSKNSPAKVFH